MRTTEVKQAGPFYTQARLNVDQVDTLSDRAPGMATRKIPYKDLGRKLGIKRVAAEHIGPRGRTLVATVRLPKRRNTRPSPHLSRGASKLARLLSKRGARDLRVYKRKRTRGKTLSR